MGVLVGRILTNGSKLSTHSSTILTIYLTVKVWDKSLRKFDLANLPAGIVLNAQGV
jgi:hypothetical protein